MKFPRMPWLAMALVVILLGGAAVDDALAKKAKSRLSAFVNAKKLKASKRGLTGVYATTSFSIGGAAKRKHGIVRTVTATCGPVDVKARCRSRSAASAAIPRWGGRRPSGSGPVRT